MSTIREAAGVQLQKSAFRALANGCDKFNGGAGRALFEMNNNKSALFLFTFLFVLRARFLGHALMVVGALLFAASAFTAPPPV